VRPIVLVILAVASIGSTTSQPPRGPHGDLLVAAAASLSGLAPQLAKAFHDASGMDIRFNFGSSNMLARQIVEGARADVFFSADAAQMDFVEQADRLVPGTRADILSNRLVIIVPEYGQEVLKQPDDLAVHSVRRLAMGDPAAVPVGVYARQWLEAVRLWTAVERKVVPLPTSPAVVAAVREGRAQAGIVYATDAMNARVRVAHVVASEDAPEIVYPAAAVRRGRESSAKAFLNFLHKDAARRVFEAAGFRVVVKR
jgi:molybdate transport system substrate-binding protein